MPRSVLLAMLASAILVAACIGAAASAPPVDETATTGVPAPETLPLPANATPSAWPGSGPVTTFPPDGGLEISLPPTWRWAFSQADLDALAAGAAPDLAAAVERIQPIWDVWRISVAVDMGTYPGPGGSATYLVMGAGWESYAWGSLTELEAQRRAAPAGAAAPATVERLEQVLLPAIRVRRQVDGPTGPLERADYLFLIAVDDEPVPGLGRSAAQLSLSFIAPTEQAQASGELWDGIVATLAFDPSVSLLGFESEDPCPTLPHTAFPPDPGATTAAQLEAAVAAADAAGVPRIGLQYRCGGDGLQLEIPDVSPWAVKSMSTCLDDGATLEDRSAACAHAAAEAWLCYRASGEDAWFEAAAAVMGYARSAADAATPGIGELVLRDLAGLGVRP